MSDKRKADVFAGKGSLAGGLAARRRAMEEGDLEGAAEAFRQGAGQQTKPIGKEGSGNYLEHFNDEEYLRKGHNTSAVYKNGKWIQTLKRPKMPKHKTLKKSRTK